MNLYTTDTKESYKPIDVP